jgi:3-oxoacyl-[acyl-carrier protein] reductase
MDLGLTGKVALVTGADRGIGRAAALTLAREGCDLILAYYHGDLVWEVLSQVESLGRRAMAVWADVANAGHVQDLVQQGLEKFARIDILVNSAGIFPGGSVEEMLETDWDRVIDTNLKGTFLVSQAVIPAMKDQGAGTIVNLSSCTADVPTVGGAAYAITKKALIAFTKVLAAEVAPHGIRVNAVAPGLIETGMNEVMRQGREEVLRRQIALGRFGRPEEVGEVIAFLASPRASYVTSSTWGIDGGKFAVQVPWEAWEAAGKG